MLMECNRLPEEAKERLEEMLDDIENFNEEVAYKELM